MGSARDEDDDVEPLGPVVTLAIEREGGAARLPPLRLEVTAGPERGARYLLKRERTTIGTHENADLRLTDKTVSRFHCELSFEGERLAVRDLGSRNGTRVASVPVVHAWLEPPVKLQLGESQLELHVADAAEAGRVPLSVEQRFGALVGHSVAMRAAFARLERAAASDATVLLDGETGTGKEAAAEGLHATGSRARKPFVVVDCGALPPQLVESELFGHVRGAFTGAVGDRDGAFQAAHSGTLFLDEIGELPLDLQPKLLRALEKREVKRVGEPRYHAVDVRVIAATNRALKAEVNAKTFRSDLYYRLAVVAVRLPALRERREDLPLLVEELLAVLKLADRPEAALLRSAEVRARMAAHPWPGNVRELRNYVEQCVAMREPAALESGDAGASAAPAELKAARQHANQQFERAYVDELMARSGNNVSRAARDAGVDRKYLYRLLWKHGLR